MLVLGKVIEKASGQDYFSYIRANIYQPAIAVAFPALALTWACFWKTVMWLW